MAESTLVANRNFEKLIELLEERIVFLDGAMGTMIQGCDLNEDDYRGDRFADSTIELKGNHDLLSVTRPDIIRGIHKAFLDAGADIIETNTFNGNAPALADYGLEDCVAELNLDSARLAREAADNRQAAVRCRRTRSDEPDCIDFAGR